MIQPTMTTMKGLDKLLCRLCLIATALLIFWGFTNQQAGSREFAKLAIGDGQGWSFLNGPWSDGPEGELIPPDRGGHEHLAVAENREYSNFKARFRFKFRHPHGGARLVFRLQDSTHYYALDIPWVGQQNRNRHFWAGIVRSDGVPLQRYLHLGLVLGVVPQYDRWYQAEVECTGLRIRAWIEGRLVADLEDDTYSKGRIGLMGLVTAGNKTPHFAELQVSGASITASPWAGLTAPAQHWITPNPEVDPDAFQTYPSQIVKSKSGAVALTIPYGIPGRGEVRQKVWVRSTDDGRTWLLPEPADLPQKGLGAVFVKDDGTWVALHFKREGPPQQGLYAFQSTDEGKSWSGPKTMKVEGEWPELFSLPAHNYDRPLRLHDGTLLLAVYVEIGDRLHRDSRRVAQGMGVPYRRTNFVFRSTDDGATWSAPVRCDSNNPHMAGDKRWFCPANFSEVGMAEVTDNVILGFGRPEPDPYMWQIKSNDGGRSWEPAAFGPFPGYCITLTRTASGALVAVKRFPYLSANVSYDRGVTWDAGNIVDYPIWANHHAIEVEPNVVLVAYMGHIVEPGQADARIVRLRVTEQGLVLDH